MGFGTDKRSRVHFGVATYCGKDCKCGEWFEAEEVYKILNLRHIVNNLKSNVKLQVVEKYILTVDLFCKVLPYIYKIHKNKIRILTDRLDTFLMLSRRIQNHLCTFTIPFTLF